jgi:tetratricopeptide (TPR) repeat protein
LQAEKENDLDKKDEIYQKGLKKYPKRFEFHSNYAIFLTYISKNYNQAEKYYKKALELEPDVANVNGNYAVFLKDIRKNYNQAEKYYKKALEPEPDNANINNNFWDIFSVLFGIFHFSYQDLSLFQLAIRNPTKRVIVLLMLLIHHFLYQNPSIGVVEIKASYQQK